MAKPVQIGAILYPTKKAAKDTYRSIRDGYEDGARLNEFDHQLLLDLIMIHPEAEQKMGCGISHFTVETDQEFRTTRHFMIHRTDESPTDVSFNSAIDGRNPRKDRLEALRRAIAQQITDFKDTAFASEGSYHCPLSGQTITQDEYHVDHVAPKTFHNLVTNWLAESDIILDAIEITPPQDNQYVCEMTDEAQRGEWSCYHREHAELRLLSPRANLSDARRGE